MALNKNLIKQIIQTLICKMRKELNFSLDKYAFCTNVPIKSISPRGEKTKSPLSMKDIEQDADEKTLDLLVCRNEDIVLCVMFEEFCEQDYSVLNTCLKGIPYITFSEKCYKNNDTADSLAKVMLSKIYNFERNFSSQKAVYTLAGISEIQSASKEKSGKLLAERMINEKGEITEYGSSCGVFRKYNSDLEESFAATERNFPKFNIYECLNLPSSKGRMSFNDRIIRVNKSLPSDEIYEEYTISALKKLLDLSLDKLRENHQNEFERLLTNLKIVIQITKFPPRYLRDYYRLRDHPTVSTYKDAVNLIYKIINENNVTEDIQNEFDDYIYKILCDLSHLVYADSYEPDAFSDEINYIDAPKRGKICLDERLRNNKENTLDNLDILRMPVSHYFFAASMLMKSNFPNWIYSKKVLNLIRIPQVKEINLSMFTVLHNAYLEYNIDQLSDEDLCFLFYNLLVEPVSNLTYEKDDQIKKLERS